MLRRYWFRGTVLAIGGMLLAGCGSVSSRHDPLETAGSASLRGTGTDVPAEKAAQAHAHYAAAVIHEMDGETEAALQEYYQAAAGDPGNEWVVLEVSGRFLQNKQPDKALELLTRAAAQPKASGAVFARLGVVYAQLGKYDQASNADRAAIKKSPESLTGYQNLFLNLLQNKQQAESLKVLDEAARQPDADAEFLVTLSELYASFVLQVPAEKEKVYAKARAVLNRAQKLSPTDARLRLRLAEGFILVGDTDKAAEVYLELLKKLPDAPFIRERVHARLADIYLRSSEHKRAVEQLEAILRDDPTNPQAYYYLGYLAFNDKKTAEAADYFSKALLLNPEFQEAYFDLALAQIGLNRTSDALATLEKARARFPEGPMSFVLEFYTGLAYSRQKAYPQALRHFNEAEIIAQASASNHLDQNLYFQLGAAAERTGDFAQAEKYFQKCLEKSPDFAEAQNYLGYMWAEHGMKLEEARGLIEKAVKAEPNNGAYLDSLGWVLFKLDRPKEALGYILKAIELSKKEEEDATLYEHLGDVYAALKEPGKAREAWTKSLSLEPNEAVRKKLGPGETKSPKNEVENKSE
ncbi:MAG TPA: tetratricopeptide repeat protein [Candidatus Binatia bacterium]|jgi:tetratricopeptide (TPR) repeat protein|nr:tetratricopeptide repeat protein [Candidatus Binatia bacterium]